SINRDLAAECSQPGQSAFHQRESLPWLTRAADRAVAPESRAAPDQDNLRRKAAATDCGVLSIYPSTDRCFRAPVATPLPRPALCRLLPRRFFAVPCPSTRGCDPKTRKLAAAGIDRCRRPFSAPDPPANDSRSPRRR